MKYYSTQRPVMPGGYPKSQKVLEIRNFDARQYVENIGREAWGWIEYNQPLTEKEAADYELMPEPSWYEVCLVVPGTDGDAENGPCEPVWWKDMVKASTEAEAIKIANEKAAEDWESPMVDEAGVEIGPSSKDLGSECPVCEWARKATEEEYQEWKADRERLEKEMADLPFA